MARVQTRRLIRIAYIWVKYGLDDILFSVPWLKSLRFLVYCNPVNWFYRQKMSKPQRLCTALEELGPIFVKFGQILSTRPDLLPADVLQALSKLQDQVQPFSGALATQMIEAELGQPIDVLFAEFNQTPIASASVAQVHTAVLHSGEHVVVKVLRPDVERIIRQDIRLMYALARLLERFGRAQRFKPREVVAELEHNLINELDLMREAANASQLKRNFQGAVELHVPQVYWRYCRRNVLVLEQIHGVPIDDVDALNAAGVDLPLLAKRGVEVFYTQVFRDNFFHADMHPGNVFVSTEDPKNPKYIAVDFGIVGSLDDEDKRYLLANFLAFFKRDYRRVAELHIESGWVPADTRAVELEAAIRTVCEPIFERPLKDISFGQTLLRLFQIAREFHMEVQPQLLLLQKTLLNIEGMGRRLYPDLDLWATAKPFLEKWMKQQIGVRGLLRRFRAQLPYISDRMPEVPGLLYQFLQQSVQHQPVTQPEPVVAKAKRKTWLPKAVMLGVVVIAGGLVWMASNPQVLGQIATCF